MDYGPWTITPHIPMNISPSIKLLLSLINCSMAGIYIHIPFCQKACHYCNFHFSTSQKLLPEMMQAIRKEAQLQQGYLSEEIQTLYFGGGTPSVITKEEVQSTIEVLRSVFNFSADPEITLEANPDDINKEKLIAWKEAGINRLSIGIQSFFEEDLQWMNRAHNAQQAQDCIEMAQQHGFSNITIDLIYGTPGLTDEKWKQNVQTALSLGIPHLSCYALTVEPKTALAKMIDTHQSENIDADKQARHFSLLTEWMKDAGFEHYEISNFARPGFRSRHNSSYWQGKSYLGLGPSAHSFNGTSRQWNVANNSLYIKNIASNNLPFEIEILTVAQQLNEYIMTSLRTMDGLDLDYVSKIFGEEKSIKIRVASSKYKSTDKLKSVNSKLILTREGKLFADGIAADLFF